MLDRDLANLYGVNVAEDTGAVSTTALPAVRIRHSWQAMIKPVSPGMGIPRTRGLT
jgi:hypothetical protein